MGRDVQPSEYAILAEILVSKKIGLTHVRLVGELIVAQARLNSWMYETGKAQLTPDGWVELIEQVLACEESYQSFWKRFDAADRDWRLREGLPELERVLADAVRALQALIPAQE
jgi:hypothetical protein